MKKFLLGLFALIIIAGAVFFLNLDNAVRKAIEYAGTEALGVNVSVGGVNLALSDKKAGMQGLTIANPEGFKGKQLLSVKDISVAIADVSENLVTIEEVVLDGLSVSYEMGPGGTNLKALEKNIEKSKKALAAKAGGGAATGEKGPEVIIKRLKIVNAELVPAIAGLESFNKPLRLPEIVLKDIGSKSDPASGTDVAAKVMNRIISSSSNTVVKEQMTAPVEGAMEKAKEGLKDLFR